MPRGIRHEDRRLLDSLRSAGLQDYLGSAGLQDYLGSAGLQDYLGSAGLQDYLGSAGLQDYLGSVGLQDYLGSAGLQDYLASAGLQDYLGSAGLQDYLGSAGLQELPGIVTSPVSESRVCGLTQNPISPTGQVLLESYDEEKDIITRKGNAKASATRRTKAWQRIADRVVGDRRTMHDECILPEIVNLRTG
ncbi:unnamed protein product [Boreogadus saida]